MKIKINDRLVDVFSGARVEDALRRYSPRTWKQVRSGYKRVIDGHGHAVDLSGELNGGEKLVVKLAAQGGRPS